jgi:hypothetical protein
MKYYAKVETENYNYDKDFEAGSSGEAQSICLDFQREIMDETGESTQCDLWVQNDSDGNWDHHHTSALICWTGKEVE